MGKTLAGMNCLIVLDDIWEVDVVEALHTAAGKNVRILLTGHKRNLFDSAGVHEVFVDELAKDEALDLLAAWTNTHRDQLPAGGRGNRSGMRQSPAGSGNDRGNNPPATGPLGLCPGPAPARRSFKGRAQIAGFTPMKCLTARWS